jgi:hypothetical protein
MEMKPQRIPLAIILGVVWIVSITVNLGGYAPSLTTYLRILE